MKILISVSIWISIPSSIWISIWKYWFQFQSEFQFHLQSENIDFTFNLKFNFWIFQSKSESNFILNFQSKSKSNFIPNLFFQFFKIQIWISILASTFFQTDFHPFVCIKHMFLKKKFILYIEKSWFKRLVVNYDICTVFENHP